jgi:hypothetical protein
MTDRSLHMARAGLDITLGCWNERFCEALGSGVPCTRTLIHFGTGRGFTHGEIAMNGKLLLIAAAGLLAASTANGFAQTPRDYGYGRQGDRDDMRVGDQDKDRMGDRDDMRRGDRDRDRMREGERRDRDDMRGGDRDDMGRGRPGMGMGTEGVGGDRDRR